jgi:Na+-translocating ferredoxin:NAD+ oxidoreductase subunit B
MKDHHRGQGDRYGKGFGLQKGDKGYCVCSQCGYSVPHQKGVPCQTVVCPHCNIPMLRTQAPGRDPVIVQKNGRVEKPDTPVQKVRYPKVVDEMCTACGACIEVCPQNCIVLEEGKAFVKNELCNNCHLCVKSCPENAFILE